MKIEKKPKVTASEETKVEAGCGSEEKDVKVESVEDINDVDATEDRSEEDIEAKKDLGISKEFYKLAEVHVKDAIDALGDAAEKGDKYAKREIADLSVILFDIQNLQRMV